MKNITKKDLQRMKELMGNKTPINENKNNSSVELIKKSPNGKYYGIVRETKKYYIKESNNGSDFDFIGGTANKIKNQFESYEQAVRRLNLMLEDTDVLTPDLIEGKKFVIRTKKNKSVEPKVEKSAEGGFGSEEETEEGGGDFDFGGEEETEEGGGDFDFGGEEETEEGNEGFDTEETEGDIDTEEDEDYDLESEDDPIKSIQKMTGKLGQKLRDTEDISSDMSKWVAKSVLSALDLEEMDGDDKKDLIRTIKKKKDEGTEEEFDFMDDDDEHKISDSDMEELMNAHEDDDMVDWNQLSDEEKSKIANHPGGMDNVNGGDTDMCSHCNGMGHDDMTGEECEWCMGTGVEHMEDYMEDDDFGFESPFCESCKGTGCEECDGSGMKRNSVGLDKFNPDMISHKMATGGGVGSYNSGDVIKFNSRNSKWVIYKILPDSVLYKELNGKYIQELPKDEFEMLINNKEIEIIKNKMDEPVNDNHPWTRTVNGVDYMEGEGDMYGPGDEEIESGEQILSDEDGCSYCGDRNRPYYDDETEMGNYPDMEEDYMSRFAKNVKRVGVTKGKKMDTHELDSYLHKIKNKLGGNVDIDGDKVVGNFGYVEVKPNGYTVHKEGTKFGKTFQFNELGRLHDYVKDMDEDYMDDPYMMPQPAPSRPQTRPETPVKPAKPDTDKPSPSKRPFTPPPHIKPGEEPNPKAKYNEYGTESYGPTEGMDYMEDDGTMEVCSTCQGRGYERSGLGFKSKINPCITCAGTGRPRMGMDTDVNPMGYEKGNSTLPKGVGHKFQYKEKFNPPVNMGENSKRNKRTIEEGGSNDQNQAINPYDPSRARDEYKPTNTKATLKPTPTPDGDEEDYWRREYGMLPPSYPKVSDKEKESKEKPKTIGSKLKSFGKKVLGLKEDHLNNKMASYEQDMAYEDVEDMARQHGMDVELCHKDRAKDPEEQTIYLDLMKKGKVVAKIRINTAGDIEMGHMNGKVFKGEPVDSHSDFDEVLDEKGIKMMPQPAPARPQTAPDTPTKPAKPDTDKPSPSKRPFTPPPHIKPGEEPNPKAGTKKRKSFSYMDEPKSITEVVKVTKAQLFKSLDKMNISDEKLNDLNYMKKLIDNVLDKEYDIVADNPEVLAKEYIAKNK